MIDDLEKTPIVVNFTVVEDEISEAFPWAGEKIKRSGSPTDPIICRTFVMKNKMNIGMSHLAQK